MSLKEKILKFLSKDVAKEKEKEKEKEIDFEKIKQSIIKEYKESDEYAKEIASFINDDLGDFFMKDYKKNLKENEIKTDLPQKTEDESVLRKYEQEYTDENYGVTPEIVERMKD